jgi:hypothetical protein
MNSIPYPKILHIGDKAIADLFDDVVEITEKIDGSQFDFGLLDGELVCRSKGKEQDLDDPDKMFAEAVEYVKTIQDRLPNNVFFFAEYLQKPRHSTLAYDNIPKNHLALFGTMKNDKTMSNYEGLKEYANLLDIDVVPLLYEGKTNVEQSLKLLETPSYLGGQKIEGIVVKKYEDWLFLGRIFTPVKAGKYVSEKFKEVNKSDWAKLNTAKGGLETLKESLKTEARWNKAIMHLKERGEFSGTVRDIGNLVKEIHHDITEEEQENIKDTLWNLYKDDMMRAATRGFVDWYKTSIAKGDFQDV